MIVVDSAGVELASACFVKNVDGKFEIVIMSTWVTCHFKCHIIEMFSELIFGDFINKVEGVQLPAEVPSDSGGQKTEFIQLEVHIRITFSCVPRILLWSDYLSSLLSHLSTCTLIFFYYTIKQEILDGGF